MQIWMKTRNLNTTHKDKYHAYVINEYTNVGVYNMYTYNIHTCQGLREKLTGC